MDNEIQLKKRKPVILAIAIGIVVLITGIVITILVKTSGNKENEYNEKLSLGQRYLSELNYEQAIISFNEAINIDPKKEEAYLLLAETYVKKGDIDKAVEVLEKSKKEVNSDNLESVKREIQHSNGSKENIDENDAGNNIDFMDKVSNKDGEMINDLKNDLNGNTATKLETEDFRSDTDAIINSEIAEDVIFSDTVICEPQQGDIVLFGTKDMDEPIKWIVLSVEDDRILLFCKKSHFCKPFNDKYVETDWEHCSLRKWLNDDLYNTWFTDEEKGRILETELDNNFYEEDSELSKVNFNNTKDRMFLLSYYDLTNPDYGFDPNGDETDYNRCDLEGYGNTYVNEAGECEHSYWLRTPNRSAVCQYACVVLGTFIYDWVEVNNEISYGVRPAMTVKKGSYEVINYNNKNKNMKTAYADKIVSLNEAHLGDVVHMGAYEQDNNTQNGKEPIEWIVMDKDDNRILLLSRLIIDNRKYDEDTWENSELRHWLNNEFFYNAFSETERSNIVTTKLNNPDNNANEKIKEADYSETEDKVFLPSYNDIMLKKNGFSDKRREADINRQATATLYARAKAKIMVDDYKYLGFDYWEKYTTMAGEPTCRWWLRSGDGARVEYSGCVYEGGRGVYNAFAGVRPYMWVEIKQ